MRRRHEAGAAVRWPHQRRRACDVLLPLNTKGCGNGNTPAICAWWTPTSTCFAAQMQAFNRQGVVSHTPVYSLGKQSDCIRWVSRLLSGARSRARLCTLIPVKPAAAHVHPDFSKSCTSTGGATVCFHLLPCFRELPRDSPRVLQAAVNIGRLCLYVQHAGLLPRVNVAFNAVHKTPHRRVSMRPNLQ